jgi:fatty acid desaturase
MNTAPLTSDFGELQRRIRAAGLLQRRLAYFVGKIIVVALLWSIGIAVLVFSRNLAILLLDAVYMAFVYGQIGLLGHDAGHQQIFNKTKLNDIVSYPCGLLVGISQKSWTEKHNRHHAHPNREGHDPDIDFPILAFSKEQVREKKGWKLWCVQHQAWLFPFLLPLVSISLRLTSLHYFFTRPIKEIWLDVAMYFGHFVWYFGLLFLLLSPLEAVLFIVVHQLLFGAYLGMVFAPNHKGMAIIGADQQIDFVREQVLTSRNIKAHAVTDFWYGGLNYQIEHHLFPTMPRNRLRAASKIVREFCAERGISYYETGWFPSLLEIWTFMREIGALARQTA